MNSIYNIYNESILDDIEVNIAKGEDDLINVEIEHIKTLLNDKNKFTFYSKTNPYTISKGKDLYYVDVNCSLTVYDFITDGTFKFNKINGNFVVSNPKNNNKPLKSLEGAPEVVYGDFDIYYGYGLKDLKYCPKIVKGDVYIGNTEITSLKYFPKNINRCVHIVENKQLNTLKDLQPCIIGNFLDFRNNAVVADLKDFKKWRIKYLNYSQIINLVDESILDDIDVGLSKTASEVLYPVPTVKDFEKTSFGAHRIKWFCKDLIQEYIKDLVPSSVANLFELNCIDVRINKNKQVYFSLKGVNELGHVFTSVTLAGIGGYTTDGLTKEKKYIIELFKMLSKDPTKFKKFYELNNKNVELYRKHEYFEYIDTKEVINRLK